MCSGCTDFSGEGLVGNLDASAFMLVLSVMYGATIQEEHFKMPMYKYVEDIIRKAETK
jgi:hypothetical protein